MTIQTKIEAVLPVSDRTRAFLSNGHKLQIGARDVDAQGGVEIPVYDPASGTVIASVPAGGKAEIDIAIAAARSALGGPYRAHLNRRSAVWWHQAVGRRARRLSLQHPGIR